jgi:hypothetical protein
LANDGIKTVDFFLGIDDCLAHGLAKTSEFAFGDDMGNCPAGRVDKKFRCASSPGSGH